MELKKTKSGIELDGKNETLVISKSKILIDMIDQDIETKINISNFECVRLSKQDWKVIKKIVNKISIPFDMLLRGTIKGGTYEETTNQ